MAPALLTSLATDDQVLIGKSSTVLSIEVEPAFSEESSKSNSDDDSPTSNTMSKTFGNAINENDTISLMSTKILEIIFDYALNKFDDSRERLEAGRPRFIEVLNEFVKAGSQIDMALPAFPFKSANKVYKALGFLPDKAEELALSRLHNMCRRIEEIYAPGANVVIISDGLVYNGWFHTLHMQNVLTRIARLVEHFGQTYLDLRTSSTSNGCRKGFHQH